ncbi:MAG: SelB C-terminal domain-containing protein [Gammaproteobacteria bacterium]
MTVLATAGHVDHGKSTLVNFLTGQETDRLKEEKQRGLTISLGYTYFDYEKNRFSIVDVPGHTDYFKNTISGFSNVDGVLFCVDSTQGWSQQSEEHFLSLINLGINNLLFFLTKTDKKDIVFGKNELINKLIDFKEINYSLVEFSSINSDKKSVQKIIYEFFNKSESNINPPSLWVDRVFSIEGIGKVITGTASKNMSFDKVFVDDQQTQLDIREVESVGQKLNTLITSSSRIAISLKNNKSDPRKGSLLTNQLIEKTTYMLIRPNTDSALFLERGTLRIYVGTHTQIIKKYRNIKIDNKMFLLVQLEKNLPVLSLQKVLVHNLSKKMFIGGSVVHSTNNSYLIKKLNRDFRMKDNINSEEIFTLIPENLLANNSEGLKRIGKFFIKNNDLKNLEKNIKSNIIDINKSGVGSYFYKNFYIEKKELKKLIVDFKSIKIQKDQIVENKILDIDSQLLAELKSQLGNALNVNEVDLRKYDTEAIKSLFMNGCLFRVSKNIIISEDQRDQLLEIIDSLPNNFSVTDFKEQSSLTRKYAIPYLEFLDKELVTKKIESNGLRTKIN